MAWYDFCLTKGEEGLGFRSLFDIDKSLYAKLWCILKHKSLCGIILYELNIPKSITLKW